MKSTAAYTYHTDSAEAGRDLGDKIAAEFEGQAPDAVIVFASSQFDFEMLLEALQESCPTPILVGSSSAGEFTHDDRGEGTACALALHVPNLKLSAGVCTDVSSDRARAARELAASFQGMDNVQYPYRSALIMMDALAGHTEDFMEQLTLLTSGKYQFAGGGAGDDAKFERTHVFFGTKAYTNAAVGLEFLSERPLGIGVEHGWSPGSRPLRVTESSGTRVTSLNGSPAIEAFEAYAEATSQTLDRNDPLPFFLHNILGIDTGFGHRLRVPLSIEEDGSITCAAEVPEGAKVHIMRATAESAVTAASNATAAAVRALDGQKPGAALFFDCVATRLRMGDVFGFELDTVAQALHGAKLVGCNTYGQIARAEGQFSGFHNCTAVVLVLPE